MSDLIEKVSDLLPLSPDHNWERLVTLKKLLPDLFSNDGQLNVDELKKLIDPALVSETERYDFRRHLRVTLPAAIPTQVVIAAIAVAIPILIVVFVVV